MNLYLGLDFGTSGARAIAIDAEGTVQAQASYPYVATASKDWVTSWQTALFALIEKIPLDLRQSIRAIAIDGTSSTVLICNSAGRPIDEPILYNDARGATVLEMLQAIAPANHSVISATSSLAKLLWWTQQPQFAQVRYFLHQADWLSFLLHGKLGISDYHNSLKLGYDAEQLCYPAWLESLPMSPLLPQVVAPGTPIGPVKAAIATQFSLRSNCLVCAGTTDSIAAFLASGAQIPGEAVTSLGSTLVLKLLSQTRIDDTQFGIYSHRLGEWWLVGGASNTGGAVLQKFFSSEQLETLSEKIPTEQESSLHYYPLQHPGERFPINDAALAPQLEPRPEDPVEFLHGLLESMARIEAQGYELLQKLGATPLKQVYTAGGGANNSAWTKIRERQLKTSVVRSAQTEAAYGTALLAMRNCNQIL
ncbi:MULTISPECIES: FGGY-family carbohydrate kinase [Trichocoleus]|uniref:FGGY-family carbohydrate kinase n=1 Tax=Trichocoleus desertorum GB2-A4 TaxID=2933944 RepID=A0ABV0J3C4_9CYAN|nr:FGGY-family carbohydrate kinase [Trichocoleus sp. FACHB-46]MBD1861619.1 FGGY-family carbohydrate kinase [Trichocoleus sp. FACHB-46]